MFITPRDGFDIAGQVATPKMKDFCPNYGNKEVNTQNVEKFSIDSIFIDNFRQNIKSFCKQNSM